MLTCVLLPVLLCNVQVLDLHVAHIPPAMAQYTALLPRYGVAAPGSDVIAVSQLCGTLLHPYGSGVFAAAARQQWHDTLMQHPSSGSLCGTIRPCIPPAMVARPLTVVQLCMMLQFLAATQLLLQPYGSQCAARQQWCDTFLQSPCRCAVAASAPAAEQHSVAGHYLAPYACSPSPGIHASCLQCLLYFCMLRLHPRMCVSESCCQQCGLHVQIFCP